MVGGGADSDGHSGSGVPGGSSQHRPSDRPGVDNSWRNPTKDDGYGGNRYGSGSSVGGGRGPGDTAGGDYGRPPYDRYPAEPGSPDYGKYSFVSAFFNLNNLIIFTHLFELL